MILKKDQLLKIIYDDLLQIEFPLKNIGDTIFDFEEFDGKMRYKKIIYIILLKNSIEN